MSPTATHIDCLRHLSVTASTPLSRKIFADQLVEYSGLIIAAGCPPVESKRVAPSSATPRNPGPLVGIRKNLDCSDISIKRGHTVRLGATLGMVTAVRLDKASVRWSSGIEDQVWCRRLCVVEHVGRVLARRVPR